MRAGWELELIEPGRALSQLPTTKNNRKPRAS